MTTSITIRYFDTSGAGAADGSSWDDRAPLASGTNWSPYITTFPYSINNILHVHIGSGTYSISQVMRKSIFTTAPPESSFSLHFIGCDNSGNAIVPDYSWRACDGVQYDYSAWPLMSNCVFNENDGTSNGWYNLRTLRLSSTSYRTVYKAANIDWCFIKNTYAVTGEGKVLQECGTITNCIFEPSTNFDAQVVTANNTRVTNCLFLPPSSITGGTCAGIYSYYGGSSSFIAEDCAIIGYNYGIYNTVSSTYCRNNTIYNAQAYGIRTSATISVVDNYINATGIGFLCAESGNNVNLTHNRIIADTPIVGSGYVKYNFDNYTSSGDVYNELTDPDNNDVSIKNTSLYYGQNIGAGDELSAEVGVTNYIIRRTF